MGTLFTSPEHRGTEAPRPEQVSKKKSQCLGASVFREGVCRRSWLIVAILMGCLSPLPAQQLLDKVVARVGNSAITFTDVNAAIALGIVAVPPAGDQQGVAIDRLIERQLVLAEVARFAPPEPDITAVDADVAAMKARAGARLADVMQSTGLDEARIRDLARDTLRIQAYLNQRFGLTVQVSDQEVTEYYRARPEEFARNGTTIPFEAAEPVARQRAAAARRAATIAQWMGDLKQRAEVSSRR